MVNWLARAAWRWFGAVPTVNISNGVLVGQRGEGIVTVGEGVLDRGYQRRLVGEGIQRPAGGRVGVALHRVAEAVLHIDDVGRSPA